VPGAVLVTARAVLTPPGDAVGALWRLDALPSAARAAALDAGDGLVAVDLTAVGEADRPEGVERRVAELHAELGDARFSAVSRAFQLVVWAREHRFCGRCGTPTEPQAGEHALACPACELVARPRIAPVVIVLVERGGKALLARSPHFLPGVFSTLAGFTEPGESLEETVVREVREEVGLDVGDVRYFGSQTWPYPHSLLTAFFARSAGGELRLDPDEIAEAAWFAPDDVLPGLPPPHSISRRIIDAWIAWAS
jgi:NAD+ diphosphatase